MTNRPAQRGVLQTGLPLCFVLLVASLGRSTPATARTLGVVANHAFSPDKKPSMGSLTIFDADTDTVLGSVPVGPGHILDCSVNPAQTRVYVASFDFKVWVIDLTSSPPALASGPNPVPISNFGEDTALTADGRFLLVCGGIESNLLPFYNFPVSVIDTVSRSEVGTFYLDGRCTGVEVCRDGSVLAIDHDNNSIRRLTIDNSGALTNTGEVLSQTSTNFLNVFCAPDSRSGFAVSASGRQIMSFRIPGLNVVDTRNLAGDGISGVTNAVGDRVFVRSRLDVAAFAYDSTAATFSAAPLFSISPVADALRYFGVDQMAVHPNGSKLYVSDAAAQVVRVHDPLTGALLSSITDPSISEPVGVCLPAVGCYIDGIIEAGEQCDDGNTVDGDGCSADCRIEPCYSCSGQPSICSPVADGTRCLGSNNDDCLNTCTAGACTPHVVPNCCGNGTVDPGESCDDGNQADGDLCSSTCSRGLVECYRSRLVGWQRFPWRMQVVDPFTFGTLTENVWKSTAICNPVNKDGEDPAALSQVDHLEGYAITRRLRSPGFVPIRNQKIVNELGTTFVDVLQPLRLLVPTAKQLDHPPSPLAVPSVDHFTCYKVKRTPGTVAFTTQLAKLDDEFGPATVEVGRPTRLCVPTDTTGEDLAARHHLGHLLCYRINRPFTPIGGVFVNNQFGSEQIYPMHRDELCVPSLRNP